MNRFTGKDRELLLHSLSERLNERLLAMRDHLANVDVIRDNLKDAVRQLQLGKDL